MVHPFKSCFSAAVLFAVMAGRLGANYITLQPSANISFAPVYYGEPAAYATVSGTATGGGWFSLNTTDPTWVNPDLSVTLVLTIGANSLGGGNTNYWLFSSPAAGVVIPVTTTTIGASALVWLPDDALAVSVGIHYSMSYRLTVRGTEVSPGVWLRNTVETGTVHLGDATVYATANQDFVPPPPEPAEPGSLSLLLIAAIPVLLAVQKKRLIRASLHGTKSAGATELKSSRWL